MPRSKPIKKWSVKDRQLATDAASIAVWRWNVDTDAFDMDEPACELWGMKHTDHLKFEHLSEKIHPADRDRVRAAFTATRSMDGPFEIDFRIMVDKSVRWISARGKGADQDIKNREMFGVFINVTGRKQAEEGNELMAGEMSHRVKNLLAIAGSLTALTSKSAKTVDDMTRDLTRRLTALGRAHDLVRPLPKSQGAAALLGDIVTVLLAPYDDTGAFSERVRVAVPRMGIGENSANTLAMVMHELATNSAKHGALSTDVGMLEITGCVTDNELEIIWAESGGPEIDGKPELGGFGSKMIAQIIEAELFGAITYDWQPTGLIAKVTANADQLSR